MPFSLLPKTIVPALPDLTPRKLGLMGVQVLMLDFDNTVVPYTNDLPSPAIRAWLRTMDRAGVQLCVVSNSKKDRVKQFCAQWNLPCYTHCRKPSTRGLQQAAQSLGVRPEDCALAGDQIFTDTLAANRAGMRSILVKPIHLHTPWLWLRHLLEQPFIFIAKRRNAL